MKAIKMIKSRPTAWTVAAVAGTLAFAIFGVASSVRFNPVEPSRSGRAAFATADVESSSTCMGPVMSPSLMAQFESTMNDMVAVLPRFDELTYLPFVTKIDAYKRAAYHAALLRSVVNQSSSTPLAVKDELREAEHSFASAAYAVSQQMALSWSGASDEALLAYLEEEMKYLGDGLAFVANAWSRLNGCEVSVDY